MNDLEILNPITELKLADGTPVTIRELSWPDALVFISKLAKQAGSFTSSDGRLEVSPEKLSEIVISAQDLSEWLVLKSTGKDDAWLKERTFSEGLDLVEAAVSMNLRPDFFAKLKRIGSRFTGVLKASPPQSTSLSGKATPAVT
jgi:hypothetical protein